jgi:hypothetical protein
MIIVRRGRVLDPIRDTLFPSQTGNGITLARTATDNYIRPRTPNVDCTTTHHTPTPSGYDDGSQTNRWVAVAGRSLPEYVAGVGWQFGMNSAIRTSYNIPTSITQYTARVVIPPPYFPTGSSEIPPEWCVDQIEGSDTTCKTISGLGIRWGDLFWGVGHYKIRCPFVEDRVSACLILVAGDDVGYHFPIWGNVSEVELTIQRVSSTQARVIATSSAGSYQLDIDHSLSYSNPYQAEYFVQQVSLGCSPLEPIAPYTLMWLRSPSIQYTYTLSLDTDLIRLPIYLQIKSFDDPHVPPVMDVSLQVSLIVDGNPRVLNISYEYNSNTNLWHSTQPIVLDSVEGASVVITTNHILERVSVLIGGAELYYVPAPHQVEWMAVIPVEMEQSGVPDGIIPAGYETLGISDYTRVLADGTIILLPAQHARVITVHLRETIHTRGRLAESV